MSPEKVNLSKKFPFLKIVNNGAKIIIPAICNPRPPIEKWISRRHNRKQHPVDIKK